MDMAGQRHLIYVLALFEAALALIATLGQAVTMGGNPFYIVTGVAEAALFIVAAAVAASGRRWGLIVLIVCDGLRLTGWGLSTLIGLLPWVQLPLTGATLTDGLILPLAVVLLAARLWSRTSRPPAATQAEPALLNTTPLSVAPAPLAPTLVEVGR